MNRPRVPDAVRHAVVVFVVSTILLVAGGVIGTAILQYGLGMYLHTSDNVGIVLRDGGLIMLVIGFPTPFLFAGLSTVRERRGDGS